MPRSRSPRKYRSYRDKGKYQRRSSSRDSYSLSRSCTTRYNGRKNYHRHHRNHDRSYYKDDYKRHHKYYQSSNSERSRDRSTSSYSRKKKNSRKNYKDNKYHKYDKYDRKPKHYYKSKDSIRSDTESDYKEKTPIAKYSEDEKDRTQDAGHYKYKVGSILNDRYRITKHLGDGTFGRVLEAEDLKTHKHYAIKVIRAVERYVDSAQTEASILEDIKSKDPDDLYQIVRLETAFLKDPSRPYKEQNYFMIFERLGMSLYDFLKRNNYRGFDIEYIQSFARQILKSVGFMHSLGLTHTDLKPENILLVNDDCERANYNQHSGVDDRSSTCSHSEEIIYFKPRFDKIKIIDMGGATYDDDESHDSIINTRQYRAPEVMLGCCQWGHPSDVWSIGCILIELFTGNLFFETHETLEHLAMIDKACGPIPYWMGNRADSKMQKNFVLDEGYYRKYHTFYDWPNCSSSSESVRRVEKMSLIEDVIPSQYPEFRDLLRKMLTIDPDKRTKCNEALRHEFFKVDYQAKH